MDIDGMEFRNPLSAAADAAEQQVLASGQIEWKRASAWPRFQNQKLVLFRLTFDANKEFATLVARIEALISDPAIIGRILRAAVAETILRNIRNRFIRDLPNALEMEKESGGGGIRKRQRKTEEMAHVKRAYEALQEAQQTGDTAGIAAAHTRLMEVRDSFVKSLNRSAYGHHPELTPSTLSTGKFRPYALRVLNLMTAANLIQVTADGNGIHVGAGNEPLLRQIQTPSATPKLTKHETFSRYATMWRHLEFGTGMYAKGDPAGGDNKPATRYNENLHGGRWYYDRKLRPSSLILRGSKGIHALKEASGQLYTEDVLSFPNRFAAEFAKVLTGARLLAVRDE